jgi:phenylalanyl-tRNA synthetase beta chain
MRVPVSWLRELVSLPVSLSPRDIADALVRQGLEVEGVELLGADLVGELVVARVLSIEALTEFKKPIRWVSLDAGETEPRWVICGAENFKVDDLVVVVKPGSVLPGGFAVSSRETYGHVSDGMICSSREMGMGDDHSGIVVLPPAAAPIGSDAIKLLGLHDSVIDIAVTTDRGYALSMRGIAREVATAFRIPFADPVQGTDSSITNADASLGAIEDTSGVDRLVLRRISGVDASASSPLWMQRRLTLAGMRPISLAVDITNYVMLELGQPLHAFDGKKVSGGIRVRRANPDEQLETLDHVVRKLSGDDLVISDGSGVLALAGTMGGLSTEIDSSSTDILLEAAHFTPEVVARMSRRHKLSSEASRRFERGIDHELGPVASARAAALFCEIGGATVVSGLDIDKRRVAATIDLDPEFPSTLVGYIYEAETVERRLEEVGCRVEKGSAQTWRVFAPSWRPDLTLAEDLVEEIARLEGYEVIPSLLPTAPASRGLTPTQQTRRRVGVTLAAEGFIEVVSYPFIGPSDLDGLGIGQDDPRYPSLKLANPISETSPMMRTTLLPGLVTALKRNLSRGTRNLALFELGPIFVGSKSQKPLPRLGVDHAPSVDELSNLMDLVPRQPQYVSGILCGDSDASWSGNRAVEWSDAIAGALAVARAAGAALTIKNGALTPWHPGRCAELWLGERLVGHAGELHPRVVAALDLPVRTVAFEIDLDALGDPQPVPAPTISSFPPALQDVALVVDSRVSAADLTAALMAGGAPLLESAVLFDVYQGEQVGAGRKSLAFTLTFRAQDRTLTAAEAANARAGAVAAAAGLGAELRDSNYA